MVQSAGEKLLGLYFFPLINFLSKAFAAHIYNADWEYHHHIGIINRTSFLLNYLSDWIDGAQSYSDWCNGDLYEQTTETFGICAFPGQYQPTKQAS